MRAQMIRGTQLCIIISLLIIGACVHKPDTFSMDIIHNQDTVYFEQSMFSKGSGRYKMGHPALRDHNQTFKFTFELNDISALYYTYLSIETWDVQYEMHPIFLNDQKIGYLNKSIDSDPNRGNTDIPYKLEATQIYLPKRFFRQGLNTLEIKAKVGSNQWQSDSFAIGRLDIVVCTSSDPLGQIRHFINRHFP